MIRYSGFVVLVGLAVVLITAPVLSAAGSSPAAEGSHPYEAFTTDTVCADCHVDITRQHHQAMMSQSFVHHWDEIEYFRLALPHAERVTKVAEVKAGCNGCHAPLAYLAGDIPPRRPHEGSRANEGVSCDLCHSITGFEGAVPYNFNYTLATGDVAQGARGGGESPYHGIAANPFLHTAELCGTCHNEKDPYGVWVKSTQLEWKESPYAEAGIVCQDCHMPPAAGNSAPEAGGRDLPDVRQHLFQGAHDEAMLRGAVTVRIHPDQLEVEPGDTVVLTASVVNTKAGHMIPSGSAEERVVWLDVRATDAAGRTYHLPVDPKGFDGEALTIADPDALAYQDIGMILEQDDFRGLPRDGEVPGGDRIFRLPYLDPDGRMTIAQWHTASLGPDYRLPPLSAKNETFTWALPDDIATGPATVTARVHYSRLVSSVAAFLGVPREESKPVLMSDHSTVFQVRGGV